MLSGSRRPVSRFPSAASRSESVHPREEVDCLQPPVQVSWRRSLWLIWFTQFTVSAGFSLIMPFLPLYVESMGVSGRSVELWSGAIFSACFVSAAVAMPFWGRLSDRAGRRPIMIRSCIGMGIAVSLMGLATHPWQLMVLRLLLGGTFGLLSACIAYMAAITPKQHTGYMLGVIQTAVTSGGILGPFLGGILASFMGYAHIFYINGAACFVSAAIVMFLIKEEFTPPVKRAAESRILDDMRTVAVSPTLLAMSVVVLVQCFSIMNAEPIIPRYLQSLHVPDSILSFLSGAVFSVVGIATAISAPLLGRLGDRVGYKKVLLLTLGGAAVMYTLQGLAVNWWQLMVFRFGQGCFTGGVFAAANALTSLASTRSFQGRAFSLSSAAQQVGNFLGPLIGAGVAAGISFRAVFPITGVLCLANLIWVWVQVPDGHPEALEDDGGGGEPELVHVPAGH